jgi:hypothetical protein
MFSGLQPQLRDTLKFQELLPYSEQLPVVAPASEEGQVLFSTQPLSPSSSTSASSSSTSAFHRASTGVAPPPAVDTNADHIDGSTGLAMDLDQSPPSTSRLPPAVLRTVHETANGDGVRREAAAVWPIPPPPLSPDHCLPSWTTGTKKQKKKGKAKAPANLYAGHPWDCTGIVPRVNDYGGLPPHLARCK